MNGKDKFETVRSIFLSITCIVILFFLALAYAPNNCHAKPISGDDKFESPVSECSGVYCR